MPFNSETYHRNKRRQMALDYLALARASKAAGRDNVATLIRLARISWKIYLSQLRVAQLN